MSELDLSDTLVDRFKHALKKLDEAPAFSKPKYQVDFYRAAADLIDQENGFSFLLEQASHFHTAGVFHTGPWQDITKLLPELVAFGLKSDGQAQILESLSELRILAVAEGKYQCETLKQQEAQKFIKKVVCLNLDLMFFSPSEESRGREHIFERAQKLIAFLAEHIPSDELLEEILLEITEVLAQRPILNSNVKMLIQYASQMMVRSRQKVLVDKINFYIDCEFEPSPLSKETKDLSQYRAKLRAAKEKQIDQEVECFRKVLEVTGFGNPYHAILLRFLNKNSTTEKLAQALNLDGVGAAELERHRDEVQKLIRAVIVPQLPGGVTGLSGVLNRGLLSQEAVTAGIFRLIDMDTAIGSRSRLMDFGDDSVNSLTPNQVLMSGVLEVLGHPLGVGQGANPTCQAARAISLWAQYIPDYLISLLSSALRNDLIEMKFAGEIIKSSDLIDGLASLSFDATKLDSVSRLLVPHLDKIYSEMMKRASYRGEDPHKWVNPAFYGRMVPNGFCSVIDANTGMISNFRGFIRRFYATHHMDYLDSHILVYPNPVGLFITNIHGTLLGPHAVLLNRIAKTESGEVRAYFYNPNNESRQDWGGGITCKVSGNGERIGEVSLNFEKFASRLYAFHFNPYEEGDAYAVPEESVIQIEQMVKDSWGKAYQWS